MDPKSFLFLLPGQKEHSPYLLGKEKDYTNVKRKKNVEVCC
jgi:hypothetical protein